MATVDDLTEDSDTFVLSEEPGDLPRRRSPRHRRGLSPLKSFLRHKKLAFLAALAWLPKPTRDSRTAKAH